MTIEFKLQREQRRATTRRATTRRATTRRPPRRTGSGDDAYLTVGAIPWGKVYVDRRMVAPETPLLKHKVSAGRHTVKVYYPSLRRFSKVEKVSVRPGQTKKLFFRD